MKTITLTKKNLDSEHICCALSSKSTVEGVDAKKAWVPITAPEYLYINCFWVSGSYKDKGYGKALLLECETYAKQNGYKGVVLIVVGSKKKPFISDKEFMIHHGYYAVDSCKPYFELLAKSFTLQTTSPCFNPSAHQGMGENIKGIDVFYTPQYPFTIPYIRLLNSVILTSKFPIRLHHITTRQMAQEHICPITTYSGFINGIFYTQEILTPNKLSKIISKYED